MSGSFEEQLNNVKRDFINYVFALRQKGYAVSISFIDKTIPSVSPELRDLEAHIPKVCEYLKSDPKKRKFCIINKNSLLHSKKGKLFYGCCHAGVEEYVFPIKTGNILVAYINLSGFCGKLQRSKERFIKTAQYAGVVYKKLYKELSFPPPDENFVLSVLTPLNYIAEKLYDLSKKISEEKAVELSPYRELYGKILDLLYENFTDNDCVISVAEKLGYSVSHIRYVFKNQSGKSLYEFIFGLKLKKAENLLKNSNFSVTLVASLVGFNDSNHFSTAFKKAYGVSPKKYRKSI